MASRPAQLRVLMTADTLGGVYTYALELAAALAPESVEVVLATMGRPPTAAQSRAAARLSNLKLLESSFSLEWMTEPWEEVDAAGEWLLDLARTTAPDLVHVNGFAHASLPFHVPVVVVCHSCVCSWWRAVRGTDAPESWNEYRNRVAAGLSSATAVVAPTAAILEQILDCYPVNVRGRVIPNGCRLPSPTLVQKQPVVLGAGRLWDEAKNLALLDACAIELPWPVYLAGPTQHPNGGSIEPRAATLLGNLSAAALSAWMARASIYALPAHYEPFGLSALEAASRGCALVLGDIKSLREIWQDAALYVDPTNPDALTKAVDYLIRQPTTRKSMAERALARAQAFSPAPMARRYRTLYDELLAPQQRLARTGTV